MITPYKVYYTVEAKVIGGDPLDVKSATISVDADRINFTEATLVCALPPEEVIDVIDPRAQDGLLGAPIEFRIRQFDASDDTQIGNLPPDSVIGGNDWGELWTRSVEPNYMTGECIIRLASGESMMSDKLSISAGDVDTGATTVEELVEYCLFNVFGGASYTIAAIVSATNIPAGDRRLRLIGNDMLSTCRNELDAINCRLSDYFGRLWKAEERHVSSATVWEFSTFTQDEGAPAGFDPIVTEFTRTITRDGDWADGVLAKFDWTSAAGTRTVGYHRTGAGVNTKGFMKTYNRPKPAANTADQLLSRTVIRGDDITITARNRFDILPYEQVHLYHRNGALAGNIRSIEWNTDTGLMTVRAQTGAPVE